MSEWGLTGWSVRSETVTMADKPDTWGELEPKVESTGACPAGRVGCAGCVGCELELKAESEVIVLSSGGLWLLLLS